MKTRNLLPKPSLWRRLLRLWRPHHTNSFLGSRFELVASLFARTFRVRGMARRVYPDYDMSAAGLFLRQSTPHALVWAVELNNVERLRLLWGDEAAFPEMGTSDA